MNVIKVVVEFKNGICFKDGISVIIGDYNSTKIVFDFDVEDGIKIFELKNPKNETIFIKKIENNEVDLVGIKEDGSFYSLFQEPGEHIFEISLYDGDSKLTSASDTLEVKPEQVVIGDEIVEAYLPIFDQLMNNIEKSTQYAQEQGDYAKDVGEQLLRDKEKGLFNGKDGRDGEQGPKGEDGKDYQITEEDYQEIADVVERNVEPKFNEKIEEVEKKIPDVSNFITNTVDNLVNYYKKSETYTQEEINERISKIPKMTKKKVNVLPEIGDEDTFYIVPSQNPSEQNEYEEYIWIDNKWEFIGTTQIDLSGYVKFDNLAADNKTGVLKSGNGLGVGQNTGIAYAVVRTFDGYNSAPNESFISKGTLENVITGKGLVSNTDYPTSTKAGVSKVHNNYGIGANAAGFLHTTIISYNNYLDLDRAAFIGKGTLDNVLNARIGDIDTILDFINGEIVEEANIITLPLNEETEVAE